MLPSPVLASYNRRTPLAISLPGAQGHGSSFRPHFRPSGRAFFRYLPWLVGCTIVLWLFVLHSDGPPIAIHPLSMYPGKGHHHPPGPPPHPWEPGPGNKESPGSRPHALGPHWRVGGKNSDTGTKPKKPPSLWDHRANAVRDAFIYAYRGYLTHADGYDELLPVGGSKVNNFNGWGTTLYDALDTMWIMDLHDFFRKSLSTIAKSRFYVSQSDFAPFFETTIRNLGGLLSAYALSGEPILLSRADDLGRMLLPAFDTPSGLPMFAVNTVSGSTKAGWAQSVLWAEAMSNQMEYKYLAHLTGRREYYNKTERIMELMHRTNLNYGLFPSMWDHTSGAPNNEVYTVGAFADSAYEYLLKQWLLTGRSEPKALELYLRSANGIINNLLHITPTRNLLYVTDAFGSSYLPSRTLEHLSCFLPGLFALGVHTLPATILNEKDKEIHLWAAEGLAETCWATYVDTKTGLGPDEVSMAAWQTSSDAGTTETTTATLGTENRPPRYRVSENDLGSWWMNHVEEWEKEGRPGGRPPGTKEVTPESDPTKRDWTVMKDSYLLRPETIESFYILWRTTGQGKWRDRGWQIFESIQKHAKTEFGYASVLNVDNEPPAWKDEMPSYFLAETLKYLYLLFNDEDLIPLEHWVFNTEAHPLPIFEWTDWEKEEWGIATNANPNPSKT